MKFALHPHSLVTGRSTLGGLSSTSLQLTPCQPDARRPPLGQAVGQIRSWPVALLPSGSLIETITRIENDFLTQIYVLGVPLVFSAFALPLDCLLEFCTASKSLVITKRRFPRLDVALKVPINLLEREPGILWNNREEDSKKHHLETKVEVTDICAHVAILWIDHIWGPKARRELEDVVDSDGEGLTIRA